MLDAIYVRSAHLAFALLLIVFPARSRKLSSPDNCAGHTLPLKHGFPLRIVIPRLLAYKNAKYVERIELTDKPLSGFWVAAGYSYDGEVPEGRLRPGRY